jgi:hypothetical protein
VRSVRNRPDIASDGQYIRLRVEEDDMGILSIADENVTSWSEQAQFLYGVTIDLLPDDAKWLHERLGEWLRERAKATRRVGEAIDERKKVAG